MVRERTDCEACGGNFPSADALQSHGLVAHPETHSPVSGPPSSKEPTRSTGEPAAPRMDEPAGGAGAKPASTMDSNHDSPNVATDHKKAGDGPTARRDGSAEEPT
jgi:hypothetical protein